MLCNWNKVSELPELRVEINDKMITDKRLVHASAAGVQSNEDIALSIGDQKICVVCMYTLYNRIYTIERINFSTSSPITTQLQHSTPPKHSYQQHWQCCS